MISALASAQQGIISPMTGRASGILLHPSSLPNPYGIGDIGVGATQFLDWLFEAGQTVWQILPLGPVGQGDSPYDAKSSFAGNPLLISLSDLQDQGLLTASDLDSSICPFASPIDFAAVTDWKFRLLRRAWENRQTGLAPGDLTHRIRQWAHAPEQTPWLEDWILFAALKKKFDSRSWTEWPAALRDRNSGALQEAQVELSEEIRFQEFVQFLFFEQLYALRDQAQARGISLLGDLPFYVALDSCDVWTHRHLFDLDEPGNPLHVAGVPPDYFSVTGQRWGNPLYRWDRMADQGYAWWVERLASQLRLVDRLRLDHFRAFAGYWEIPATEPTAVVGQWRDGPGLPFFQVLKESMGPLPFVAEDLGMITSDVEELRDRLGIPGMRVLQFAFDSASSPHLPHNLSREVVLYTGTHDNDTAQGWIQVSEPGIRQRALDYVGGTAESFHWNLLRAAQTSIADLVVTPIQDVLGLDSSHRMNTPGTSLNNWGWRLPPGCLTEDLSCRLRRLTDLAARCVASSSAGDPTSS